jgi:serine/threonine protein kinase
MAIARLDDGRTIEYDDVVLGSGASKDVYRAADGEHVVAFYRRSDADAQRLFHARLRAIMTRFNPTLPREQGGAACNNEEAQRYRELFSWPEAVVTSPCLGLVLPLYPERFWFKTNPKIAQRPGDSWNPTPKTAKWFTAMRKRLRPAERGDFLAHVQVSLLLARAVQRMHQAGLAHSDLSGRNILLDPLRQQNGDGKPGCLVTDIDTLVVPGHYPPDVLGTQPYIAPEVLAASALQSDAPGRVLPSRQTDRHALAVLIYEFLLGRHPLDGPRILPVETQEEEDQLAFGREALFIEHPVDQSNRPADVFPTFDCLGGPLSAMIHRAFVTGVHAPQERPLAVQWVQALCDTLDILQPCPNTSCPWKWFPQSSDGSMRCPRCGSYPREPVPVLKLTDARGTMRRSLVCFHGRALYQWHVGIDADPASSTSPTICAVVAHHDHKQWSLENRSHEVMRVEGRSETLRPHSRIALKTGMRILLKPERGLTAEVRISDPTHVSSSESTTY